MAQLVRCKSCGFITDQSKVKDVCPACGVSAKMMEPYTDPVSEKRGRILKLEMHPIIVHFSIAFCFSTLVLAIAGLFIRGPFSLYLFATLITVTVFSPLVIILSFLSGLLDGKVRFRRVTTPILNKKIILGVLFFVFSSVMLLLAVQPGFSHGDFLTAYIVLNAVSFICSFFLGLLGASLLEAKFPG